MIVPLGFTDEQIEMLHELLKPDYLLLFQILTWHSESCWTNTGKINQILGNLPENLSPTNAGRRKNPLSLVGKVSYFWGVNQHPSIGTAAKVPQ